MKLPIYLDHHATTPLDPRVLEAMQPFLTSDFGNPASNHVFGWKAREAVEKARTAVARLIGAGADEIVFTSGATESNNLAIKGVADRFSRKGSHIITVATEHKAVLDVCRELERRGKQLTVMPVDAAGRLDLNALRNVIRPETILISVMHANNETGLIHPIAEIARIAREKEVLLHVDAAQSAGKIPVKARDWGIDLLSLSAHKFYGPKGTGALFVRKHDPYVRISPLMHGGGHEGGMRSGTLNVPAIVGMGRAADLALSEMAEEAERIARLRDRLQEGLCSGLEDVDVNGDPACRLANNLNISFRWVESESLLMAINEKIAVSAGSACTDGSVDVSHVLKALGLPGERAHTALRFGVGRWNTEGEIDFAVKLVTETVRKLRAVSPLYPKSGSSGI